MTDLDYGIAHQCIQACKHPDWSTLPPQWAASPHTGIMQHVMYTGRKTESMECMVNHIFAYNHSKDKHSEWFPSEPCDLTRDSISGTKVCWRALPMVNNMNKSALAILQVTITLCKTSNVTITHRRHYSKGLIC